MFYISANERDNYEHHLKNVERVNHDDDIVFTGNGGAFGVGMVSVGIERKKIYEDFPRCLQTHHHLDQLRRMKRTHRVVYLLIEGVFRIDLDTGLVQVLSGNYSPYSERRWVDTNPTANYIGMMRHLESVTWSMGVHVMFTRSFAETCRWLEALHGWWQKPFEEHSSPFMYQQPFTLQGEIPMIRRILGTLPGVGWKLSEVLAAHIPNPAAMNEMTEADLKAIPGIGPGRARDILNAWWGVENKERKINSRSKAFTGGADA